MKLLELLLFVSSQSYLRCIDHVAELDAANHVGCQRGQNGSHWVLALIRSDYHPHPASVLQALDLSESNTKALFRRAQAWQGLKDYSQAMVTSAPSRGSLFALDKCMNMHHRS